MEGGGGIAAARIIHADGGDAIGSQGLSNTAKAHVLILAAAVAVGKDNSGDLLAVLGHGQDGGHGAAITLIGDSLRGPGDVLLVHIAAHNSEHLGQLHARDLFLRVQGGIAVQLTGNTAEPGPQHGVLAPILDLTDVFKDV